jgi:hypothetical protein
MHVRLEGAIGVDIQMVSCRAFDNNCQYQLEKAMQKREGTEPVTVPRYDWAWAKVFAANLPKFAIGDHVLCSL